MLNIRNLCPKHEPLIEQIIRAQKAAKKIRDEHNRAPGPRHNKFMSRLNAEINERRGVLSAVYWKVRGGVGCPACRAVENYQKASWYCRDRDIDIIEECSRLSSSAAEHLVCNEEVLGSTPGRATNTTGE